MPFRSQGRTFYKTRVTLPDGREIVAGCGTDDLPTARLMERMVRDLKRKRGRGLVALERVVNGDWKLPFVFDLYESGTLLDQLDAIESPDLVALLAEWGGSSRYRLQVGKLVTGTFHASDFTKKRISEFLAGLKHSGSTKNRYRAALSVFARWLVERDVIPHNPVRDVRGFKPNPARIVWLDRGQAKALVMGLSNPYRAVEALMASCGVEWQVIERLVRRDVDLDAMTVHARGGKTPWRDRVVRPTELWAWEIFAEYARAMTPIALVFPGADKTRQLRKHKAASKVLKLPETTLHDWRHTFAVQCLRDGVKPAAIANNLGHRDTYLLLTRYGRFTAEASDYETRTLHAAEAR